MKIFRKTTFLLLLMLVALAAPLTAARKTTKITTAQPAVRVSREEYVNRYKAIAIDHQRRYGIPASITMAQGILESDCGNSRLARSSNNHFGIKCGSSWTGKSVRHNDDAKNECFRSYPSVEQSYDDHAKFLKNSPRYAELFTYAPTDYKKWAKGLKAAGYATAKDYAPKLIGIIEGSNLHELDLEAAGGKSKKGAAVVAISGGGAGIDPNGYKVSVNTLNGYTVSSSNNVQYISAKSGDSYKTISKKFSLSQSTLRKLNDEPNRKATLKAGERVYIEKKDSKWRGESRDYRVKAGETYRTISQQFGVQEAALRKINKTKVGEPSTGQLIKLRKR